MNKNISTDWRSPEIPRGFDQLCAFHYADGDIVLDFASSVRKDFASETMEVNLVWPWKDGFEPSNDDWEALGFLALYE